MRELSPSEKLIVNKIIEKDILIKNNPDNPHDICITELLTNIAAKYDAHFKIENNYNYENVELHCLRTADDTTNRTTIHSFRREFMNAVYFINYLKSERLIYIVPEDSLSINERLEYPEVYPVGQMGYPIVDRSFLVLLKSLLNNVFIPTEFLINYYKNGYRTPEDIRFERAMKTSNRGVILALCALIVTIIVGFIQILIAINPNSCS